MVAGKLKGSGLKLESEGMNNSSCSFNKGYVFKGDEVVAVQLCYKASALTMVRDNDKT